MIGHRVRQIREARGWTQSHLADAAELSLRTVQRIEARHTYAPETLLALAAAFDIDIGDLTRPAGNMGAENRPLWQAIEPRRAGVIAFALTVPALAFVTVNLLKYTIGFAMPYDALAALGASLGLVTPFESASPLLLLVAPLIALGIVLASSIRPYGVIENRALTLTGIELRWHALLAMAGIGAIIALVCLIAYLIGENLAEAVRAVMVG